MTGFLLSAALIFLASESVEAAAATVSGSNVASCNGQARPERRADLEFAQAQYVAKSRSLTPSARRAASRYIQEIAPRAGCMSDTEFLVAIMRIPAFASNGHDYFIQGDGWYPTARLPIHLIWFPDGLMVARAAPDHAELLGAYIERIDGHAPPQILRRLKLISGNPEPSRRWSTTRAIESAGMLHALGLSHAPDRLELRLRLRDGRRVSRTLLYRRSELVPQGVRAGRFWSAEPFANETELGWRTAIATIAEPLYLQEPDRPFRMIELPALNALYVQFRTNNDSERNPIAPFVGAVTRRLASDPPENLIVDLRFNDGGDIDHTRELMKTAVRATPGRVFVLVGRYSFSAGIIAAAALKHDGGTKVILVGEDVGDALRFWSEGSEACLPSSGYCLNVPTGLWDLKDGCASEPGCYGDRLDAVAGSLRPRLQAPLRSTDWLRGIDPGMNAIHAAILK